MRFIVMVKPPREAYEAGMMPSPTLVANMGAFNEEMVKAGVMLAGEGLHPSSKGALVKFNAGKPTVIDGPFAEAKELIGGFWLLQANSKAEVIDWLRRCPFEGDEEVEIRQIHDVEDFTAAMDDPARQVQ
jgi:hypothetical protein